MKEDKNIKYSEFKLVISLIVKNNKRFNIDYKLFTKQIVQQKILTNETTDINSLCDKLDLIQNKFFETIDDEFYKRLFSDGIEILKNIIKNEVQEFDLDNLLSIGDSTLKILNKEFNANVTELPNIFIVDNFPSPYDNITTWDFMYASEEDEEKYNIKEGLYIHKERQFPVYCEYLIIHELVHYFVDKIKKNKVTKYRWIEEAIANWFAFVVHYRIFKKKDFISYVKNVNELYNHIFPYSVIAEYSYYDNAFLKIYNLGGHKGIIKFCKDYFQKPTSKVWGETFDNILNCDFKKIKKYKYQSSPQNELDLLLFDSMPLTHILNLTSLEFLIIKNLEKDGISIKDLVKKSGIKQEYVENGIKQLQNRGYIIIQNEKIEIIDNVLHLFESDLIKVKFLWKTGFSN